MNFSSRIVTFRYKSGFKMKLTGPYRRRLLSMDSPMYYELLYLVVPEKNNVAVRFQEPSVNKVVRISQKFIERDLKSGLLIYLDD